MRSFSHGFKRTKRERPGAPAAQQYRRLVDQQFIRQLRFEQGAGTGVSPPRPGPR